MREKEGGSRAKGLSATELLRQLVDYSSGSPEMQVNDHAETRFRNWLTAYLKTYGQIERREAVASGAEEAGVSVQTTYRYLMKLVSERGPLQVKKDRDSKKWIVKPKPEIFIKWNAEVEAARRDWGEMEAENKDMEEPVDKTKDGGSEK